jgi:tyrosyl-tRNA synthetase
MNDEAVQPVIDEAKIERLLSRGVENIYPTKEKLREALMSGKRLRLYNGIDPTAPFLHIGHAMQLRKLREFQELGHEVIMLIGSFTAMIGDPTDKLATRKQLTKQDVLANAATYKKQASKILKFSGPNAAKLMFNDKWLAKMSFAEVVELASHFTVQQMMERDMFQRRAEEKKPIGIHEFMYPLMQGYDSVAMDVDLEVGGNDQTFNMLAGRTLLREMKQKEKFVLAISLLTNSEGKKMSKSEGGVIALTDTPEDMFGKVMSMDDSMIVPYFELATDATQDQIDAVKKQLADGVNPRDIKMTLAELVTSMYHGGAKAKAAKKHFQQVFSKREMPDEMREVSLEDGQTLVSALASLGFVSSNGEARRLVEQGAVSLDGTKLVDSFQNMGGVKGVLRCGKLKFVRLI